MIHLHKSYLSIAALSYPVLPKQVTASKLPKFGRIQALKHWNT